MEKTYSPKKVEEKWLKKWQDSGIFKPYIDKGKKPFVIVIPPPNITSALHMGHALNNVLQDILIRYKKISGENAYWVPGTDHGGIATQNVMEKILKSEGKTKEEIGREEFLNRMWKWYGECGSTILNQLKKLGCAIDFSSENIRFTMDENRAKSVFRAFKELWDKGYIYRGERLINWCPRCGTALSDLEVEYDEEKSHLWHIKYPVIGDDYYLVVATTRPETMLGDMAVAVNPQDKRYKLFIGKKLRLPLTEREIPVIADEAVDMSFGTGAVKVTPSHDAVDFEIGKRHNLEFLQVIDYDGRMINCPEKYVGKKALTVREEIISDLKEKNLLEKEEPYSHNVGKCYRCHNHIEPLISEQWFVKTKPLAEEAIKKVANKELVFYPESWSKSFMAWLENIKDWCISRQIWWGHRIPVWYCIDCNKDKLPLIGHGQGATGEGEKLPSIASWTLLPGKRNDASPIISQNKPEKCEKCGGQNFIQDPDVLDTWFSSALWPFSVFDWPQKNERLDYFYPTSVLVTGYEILYLWVARMVMSGLFHMKQLPFTKVYLHGIVRDKSGQKMSKSKGNGIDPLNIMDKYGTDAVRFSLAIAAIGGKDIPFSENSIIGGRNFVNKLYNVSRFIQMNVEEKIYRTDFDKLDLSDRWILHRYNEIVKEYKKLMDDYLLPEAIDKVYGFVWDEFCDWYLEFSKPYLNDEKTKENKLALIIDIFIGSIKMLHPFTPFVSEEIYEALSKYAGKKYESIMLDKLPQYNEAFKDEKSYQSMKDIMEVIRAIRAVRSQFNIMPSKTIKAIISSSASLENLKENISYIINLSKLSELKFEDKIKRPEKSISSVVGDYNVYILIDENIDVEKEKKRLSDEIKQLTEMLEKWKNKIEDKSFINNAPKSEVDKLLLRVRETEDKSVRLNNLLEDLKR
jgi:valyl-tRNA synthetase